MISNSKSSVKGCSCFTCKLKHSSAGKTMKLQERAFRHAQDIKLRKDSEVLIAGSRERTS